MDDVHVRLPQKPPSRYTTLLDMLDVRDPDIMNTLIDQVDVESVLLFQRRSEAAHVMERVQPPRASKVGGWWETVL